MYFHWRDRPADFTIDGRSPVVEVFREAEDVWQSERVPSMSKILELCWSRGECVRVTIMPLPSGRPPIPACRLRPGWQWTLQCRACCRLALPCTC